MPACIGTIDALAHLLEMRRRSAYGVSDGRCADDLELSGPAETDDLMAACRALLYPNGSERS